MLLHALSVTRSLSPKRNYRLGFSLIVQSLHAACGIGTGREEAEAQLELNTAGIQHLSVFMEQLC